MARAVKVPKPFRRKRDGNTEYGNYLAKFKGRDINLATQDPDEAWRRAKEMHATGKRNWKEDAILAANAVMEARMKAPPATPADVAAAPPAPPEQPPVASPPPPPAPAAAPVAAPPAAAPAAAPAAPAEPTAQAGSQSPPSPPPTPPESEPAQSAADAAAAAAEAAGEATQQRDTTTPPPPPPGAFTVDPRLMAMLVEGAAKAAVDLQLVVQAWIVHRRTGDKPGKVPPEALAVPLALWKAQFQAWGERLALDNVPPWAVAMVLTSLVMPMQYAGREKKPAAGNLGEVRDAEYSEVHTNGANGAHAAA